MNNVTTDIFGQNTTKIFKQYDHTTPKIFEQLYKTTTSIPKQLSNTNINTLTILLILIFSLIILVVTKYILKKYAINKKNRIANMINNFQYQTKEEQDQTIRYIMKTHFIPHFSPLADISIYDQVMEMQNQHQTPNAQINTQRNTDIYTTIHI